MNWKIPYAIFVAGMICIFLLLFLEHWNTLIALGAMMILVVAYIFCLLGLDYNEEGEDE